LAQPIYSLWTKIQEHATIPVSKQNTKPIVPMWMRVRSSQTANHSRIATWRHAILFPESLAKNMYSISLWNGGHIECHGFLYITLHIYALNKQEAPLSLKNCAIRKRHTAFS